MQLFVRFPLRLSHPGLGGDIMISHSQGSFQWDSAGAGHSCHRFRLHDRRASCPFSGAVRRSRLPGIVSLHSHSPPEGCDPPPSLSGGFQPCGILHTVGAAAAPPLPPPCEGGRGVNKSGSAKAYAPTLLFSHSYYFVLTTCCKNRIFLTI